MGVNMKKIQVGDVVKYRIDVDDISGFIVETSRVIYIYRNIFSTENGFGIKQKNIVDVLPKSEADNIEKDNKRIIDFDDKSITVLETIKKTISRSNNEM